MSARVFLTDGAVFERMNAAYRTRFPVDPPARATVITPLVSPDFSIEITMVAVRGTGRAAVTTPGADGAPGRPNPNLSSAIRVGPRLFLSGMLGVLPGNASDAAGQTAETLNRLERTLTAAGFGWPDVTESVVYVTDIAAAAEVLKVFSARTGGAAAAGTLVGTGLVSPDGRVEIMLNGWQVREKPMAATCSFDVTSTVDLQEVDNALNQARKEVVQRYDFKGSKADIQFNRTDNTITLVADDEFKMTALWEIVQGRMIKRQVPVKNLKLGEIERGAQDTVHRVITLQQGIPTDASRAIVKFLKDRKLKKVQAAIQADQLRISSPSRDELQAVMQLLKAEDFGVALQFGNYRES